MKKLFLVILISLFLIPILVSADQKVFEVVPGTIGIGLQQNHDEMTFDDSNDEACVDFALGNPWSENVTGWIVVEGNLQKFFLRNNPETLFVPSGTFRYNSSCCLLPMDVCFKFPHFYNGFTATSKVYSAYSRGEVQVTQTGSAVGTSVAYSLTINVKEPNPQLGLFQMSCMNFYSDSFLTNWGCYQNFPFIGTIKYRTLELIVFFGILIPILYFIVYFIRKRKSKKTTQPTQTVEKPIEPTEQNILTDKPQ